MSRCGQLDYSSAVVHIGSDSRANSANRLSRELLRTNVDLFLNRVMHKGQQVLKNQT